VKSNPLTRERGDQLYLLELAVFRAERVEVKIDHSFDSVYLRPSAEVSAALRALAASGSRLGVFTDAPEGLARLAVSQLGADRRIEALETGAGALDRLRARFGPETVIVREASELVLRFPS